MPLSSAYKEDDEGMCRAVRRIKNKNVIITLDRTNSFFYNSKRQTVLAVCRLSSENQQAVCSAIKFRACTGFDGGFEV